MEQIALSLDQARDRGALGMERAADHANREHCGWTELALKAMVLHINTLPPAAEFIIEDVRLAVESDLPTPPDRRSWGAVTQMAMRRQYIEGTGTFARAASSNASPKALYRRGRGLPL